jgi:ribonuclease J
MGLPERGRSKASLVELLEAELAQFVGRAEKRTLRDDERLEKELIRIVRQTSQAEIGKKPEVTVVVSRLA